MAKNSIPLEEAVTNTIKAIKQEADDAVARSSTQISGILRVELTRHKIAEPGWSLSDDFTHLVYIKGTVSDGQ
jgi:hypothetical protein